MKKFKDLELENDYLKEKNQQLQTELNSITEQDKTMYRQINSLLLWKSSLKVQVNISCPNKDLVGKEGYLCDLFLDGWTVIVYGNPEDLTDFSKNEFYRLDAEYLDIVEWDTQKFEHSMKTLDYVQHEGKWIHKDKLSEIKSQI